MYLFVTTSKEVSNSYFSFFFSFTFLMAWLNLCCVLRSHDCRFLERLAFCLILGHDEML